MNSPKVMKAAKEVVADFSKLSSKEFRELLDSVIDVPSDMEFIVSNNIVVGKKESPCLCPHCPVHSK